MKIFPELARQCIGDMTLIFYKQDDVVSFTMVPSEMEEKIAEHRKLLKDTQPCKHLAEAANADFPAYIPDSMAQIKVAGDAYSDQFGGGNSLRNSETTKLFRLKELNHSVDGVEAVFEDPRGLRLVQTMKPSSDARCLIVETSVANHGSEAVVLEYFAAFSLGLLSPFQPDDGPEKYRVHRILSFWSAEACLESRSVEEWNLENSWQGIGVRNLRFGSNSSMPVKGFYPFCGFEDKKAGVVWGAEIAAFGPWQLELFRRHDFFSISGGIPDREQGGWTRILLPGETLRAPIALLSCVKGDVQTLLNRFHSYQCGGEPECEKDMPVVFNDWCTTWGHPSERNLMPIAERLEGTGIRHFVMDDGWFRASKEALCGIGTWNVSKENYPKGLKAFCDELRAKGFVPGVWFEFEVVTPDGLTKENEGLLMKFFGKTVMQGPRMFLDFRKKETFDFLMKKVVRMLKDNGIGYMKVDYNAPTASGCDGEDSPAENLRVHIEGVEAFFMKLKEELPDLVLEICSSGGHRFSPAWMHIASMGSFSDAHEGVEIPVLAAASSLLAPMRRNQIWAVLRKDDSPRRLIYSLCAGFLGRLCVSGDLNSLSKESASWAQKAIHFQRRLVELIRDGETRVHQERLSRSRMHPRGWQWFERTSETEKLVVVHTFKNAPDDLAVEVGPDWKIVAKFCEHPSDSRLSHDKIRIAEPGDFAGYAFLLEKKI